MSRKTELKARVRPKKIAVLVPYNINDNSLRDVVEFLGLLWGGRYACIVPFDPTDGENSLGISWLSKYSPDIILCSENSCNKFWQDRIQEIISPLQIQALRYPLIENLQINKCNLISLSPVVDNYIRRINSTPDTTTRFKFISTENGIQNRIFYDFSFGVYDKDACVNLAKTFRAKSNHIESDSLLDFINLHDDKAHPFSFLDVSTLEISPAGSFFGDAPTIFVLARNVKDYTWFWNNKFDFDCGANNCIAVPIDSIQNEDTVSALTSWLSGYHRGKPNYCRIKSISASKVELNSLARKLRPRLKKNGYKYVDVEVIDQNIIPQVKFSHEKHNIEAAWLDAHSFEFTCPKPSFAKELSNSDGWIVDLQSGIDLKYHMPPRVCFKTNTRLLNAPAPLTASINLGSYIFRYDYGEVSIACSNSNPSKTVTLPTVNELLNPLLKDARIKEKKDEKRLCYESVIELFGGVREFTECCKNERFKILSALWIDKELPCEKVGASSKSCSIKQSSAPRPVQIGNIKQSAKLGSKMDKPFEGVSYFDIIKDPLMLEIAKSRYTNEKGFYRQNTFNSFLSWMVDTRIARKVINYPKCPSCENESDWDSKIDLSQELFCSRCGQAVSNQNDSLKLGYQLNPLVFKAFKEGIRPVVLTIGVLKKASATGFMYIPGFKGTHSGKGFDIDIIAVCDGELIFCECKDMEGSSTRSRTWSKVFDQLEQLIEKGKLCSAQTVVLASMAEAYPKKIQKLASNNTSSEMRVVLLAKSDLLRGQINSKVENRKRFPATLYEAFLPQTTSIKRKRKGDRIVSFPG